ncbi:unnamed protein product, partial [Allacma fusca]
RASSLVTQVCIPPDLAVTVHFDLGP